jgi:hypothetical protein
MSACRQLSREEEDQLRLMIDRAARERVAQAHLTLVERAPRRRRRRRARPVPRIPRHPLLPTGEPFHQGARLPASLTRHPSFRRILAATSPFSTLSRAELERQIAGVIRVVDMADLRVRVTGGTR